MNDEQLIASLRNIEDSRLSNEVRPVAGAAAERIEELTAALRLWLEYGRADFDNALKIFCVALAATEAVLGEKE